MVEKSVKAATYRSSFLVPELVEIQRRSFSRFLERGIVEELSKINPIQSQPLGLELFFYPESYLLVLPDYTVAGALLQGKTYSCKLYVPARLFVAGELETIGDSQRARWPASTVRRGAVAFKEGQLQEGGRPRPLPSLNRFAVPTPDSSQGVLPLEATDTAGRARGALAHIHPLEGLRDSNGPRSRGLMLAPLSSKAKAPKLLSDQQMGLLPDQSQFKLSWVLLANLPLMTKRGHFVINGSPRVVVNQLVRSPGVYFHERLWGMGRRKKRLIYADFVSRRGAWLRVQVDKTGAAWARLKKTPKIAFSLFCHGMAICERSENDWSVADREIMLELHEETNTTGKLPSAEKGAQFYARRFKNPRTYDLGSLGRKRLNKRLGLSIVGHQLTSEDLRATFDHIKELTANQARIDDIDHLKNRRVRASGELVQGQFETGLYRLERAVLTKMRKPPRGVTPRALIDTRPVNGALREFFGGSPLSQYMDQTNPLAEITHKRRMSSLGPGGVNRDNAGMAIRGIHPTHYGRICPIETPEGKNAGLVNSLTIYGRLSNDGMVETPYYQVVRGQVQKRGQLSYVSAEEEEKGWSRVAPGDVQLSQCHLLPERGLAVREAGNTEDDFREIGREKVNYMAISPTQMISVATSLIPFLEHDDANRALMGSNMQRQAVPLLSPERPLVGTGLESLVVAESGHALQAWASGYVASVSGMRVVVYSFGLHVPREKRGTTLEKPSGKELRGKYPPERPQLASRIPMRAFAPTNALIGLKNNASQAQGIREVLGGFAPLRPRGVRPRGESRITLNGPQYNPGGGKNQARPGEGRRRSWPFLGLASTASPFASDALTPGLASLRDAVREMSSLAPDQLARGQRPSHSANIGLARGSSRQTNTLNRRLLHGLGISLTDPMLKTPWEPRRDLKDRLLLHRKAMHRQGLDASEGYVAPPLGWGGMTCTSRLKEQLPTLSVLIPITPITPITSQLPAWHAERGLRPLRQSGMMPWPTPRATAFHASGTRLLTPIEYGLHTYHRSNQETCLTHSPTVKEGEWIQRGDLLADCSASQFGELALGKNILIAYLPWEGYNFEDAIVISERLVSDDVYTSIHVQKHEVEIRETRFGLEKITDKVAGLSARQQSLLDKRGIVKVGSWVRGGDVLVGKMTPRSPQELSPYERLAYDLADVEVAGFEDTSLRVPHGVEGRVINCQALESASLPGDGQASAFGRARIYIAERRRVQVGDKVAGRHGNKGIVSTVLPRQDMPFLPNGEAVDMVLNPLGIPSRMNVGQVFECLLGLAGVQLGQRFKVTPFDEIYGPEASRSLVYLKLYQARLRTNQDWLFNPRFPGKSALFDGRTGSIFHQWVTVGYAYMLKLVHLVDEKIHARSTGPYSLVTKQPLGGRSKHGGQRLGEMEVWALEGFGAAYTLQEMLTSKSDDIVGREQAVEAILFKRKMALGNPEAFKVLLSELQSLCIDVGVYAISRDKLQREAVNVAGMP